MEFEKCVTCGRLLIHPMPEGKCSRCRFDPFEESELVDDIAGDESDGVYFAIANELEF